SGPAVRLKVNESPSAAVQLEAPEVKDAIFRFPPVIESAEEMLTSIPDSCTVNREPSCEPDADTTPVLSRLFTSNVETLVLNNEPSATVTFEPETSTMFAARVV